MFIKRCFFPPQAQRLPVNGRDHLHCHQRELQQCPVQAGLADVLCLQAHAGGKHVLTFFKTLHRYMQSFVRAIEVPTVTLLHVHERRYMKGLVKIKLPVLTRCNLTIEYIAVLFAPGCVVHLGDNSLDARAFLVPAKIKTDRVHDITEIAQVC